MAGEIQTILAHLEAVHSKPSWYGKPAMQIFGETDESVVYRRPNANSHSLIDLLYHMVTWQVFTLRRLQKIKEDDPADVDALDWREIDPEVHTWKEGVAEFVRSYEEIQKFLQGAPESVLDEIVDYRDYDTRFLLNGLVQHNVYHLGQVAYVQKLLK